jgi:hypothetical protein
MPEMPELPEMPDFDVIAHAIATTARDAAYIAIGLGVLAVQRAQVRRQELAGHLRSAQGIGEHVAAAPTELTKRVLVVDDAVEQVLDRLTAALAPVEGQLPDRARDLVVQARTQAKAAHRQLRSLLAA